VALRCAILADHAGKKGSKYHTLGLCSAQIPHCMARVAREKTMPTQSAGNHLSGAKTFSFSSGVDLVGSQGRGKSHNGSRFRDSHRAKLARLACRICSSRNGRRKRSDQRCFANKAETFSMNVTHR